MKQGRIKSIRKDVTGFLIIKHRKVPIKILKLQALLRRLPKHHPKRGCIEDELAKSIAGFKGEKSFDYYLSFLPHERYSILHDLRLSSNEQYNFQMDTLILSPNFILITEIKNYSGTLYFDKNFRQLIRTIKEKEEVFEDPILQVNRQRANLKKWLEYYKLPNIPIVTLVAFSNPQTFIKVES